MDVYLDDESNITVHKEKKSLVISAKAPRADSQKKYHGALDRDGDD